MRGLYARVACRWLVSIGTSGSGSHGSGGLGGSGRNPEPGFVSSTRSACQRRILENSSVAAAQRRVVAYSAGGSNPNSSTPKKFNGSWIAV